MKNHCYFTETVFKYAQEREREKIRIKETKIV